MPDPLKPDLTILAKLGSIVMHAKEMISPEGHAFDQVALQQLLEDPDLIEWLEEMDKMAFIPKLRK